jgi:hypothetical protein
LRNAYRPLERLAESREVLEFFIEATGCLLVLFLQQQEE